MSVKSGVGSDMYSLKWNHYQTYLTSGLAQLIDGGEDSMTDVNLACEGQFIQAHKLILSLCSPFFKQLFRLNRMEKSNFINVVLTGVKFKDLKNIIHFIYHGQVNIGNSELNNFLKAAEVLQIEGLAGGVENDKKQIATTETRIPNQSVVTSQGPSALTPTSSSVTSNNGAPPNKRSRLSSSTSSSGIMANATFSNSRLGSQISHTSHHGTISSLPTPPVNESGNLASNVSSDPLGDDGAVSMEECGEEMINLDTMKAEPIAVYTISENNIDSDEVDNGTTRNSTLHHQGSESDGLLYEFEPHVLQTTSTVSVPGPSSSAVSRPRLSTLPKADCEEYKVPETNQPLDNFQMRCKKCGENVPSEFFQSHGCYSSNYVSNQLIGVIQPVQCTICLKTFKNRNSLKVHKSTYHRPKETAPSGMRLSHLADIVTTSAPPTTPTATASSSSSSSLLQTPNVMRNESTNDSKMFHLPMYPQPQTLIALLHQQQQSYNDFDGVEKKPSV